MIVKRLYNRNALARAVLIALYTPYFVGLRWLYRIVAGRGKLERGMSQWYDMIDWLGAGLFEVAKPEEVFRFFAARGFELRDLKTAGGTGTCNEFVFERVPLDTCHGSTPGPKPRRAASDLSGTLTCERSAHGTDDPVPCLLYTSRCV